MATQHLVVQSRPLHGLGNRVRLVLSGRALAGLTGRRFSYYWPLGRGFGARMTDLWEFSPALPRVAFPLVKAIPLIDPETALSAADPTRRAWRIRSGSAIPLPTSAPDWRNELAALAPQRSIAERIRQFRRTHLGDLPYIGVMVRTHPNAHHLTKQYSPLKWYEDRMHELVEEFDGIRFFLSCDTSESQRLLSARFPTATGLAKSGGYNSRAAILESVVDLYLLAGSCHILAPHHSSFPELAYFLAHQRIPLETSVGESFAEIRPPVQLSMAPDPISPRVRSKVD